MEIANWRIALGTIIIVFAWKILNWVWFKPKRLEKFLRQQGFSGNSYKLLLGDLKEINKGEQEANSRPIGIHDDILPRVLHYHLDLVKKYGKNSFEWIGPTPFINITDPKVISEVFLKHNVFHKPELELQRYFLNGSVTLHGEEWVRLRKIVNTAFHFEKLKDLFPQMQTSCKDMVNKWKDLIANQNSVEIDACHDIQAMAADMISRTTFGSYFEDGRKVCELIKQQLDDAMEAQQIPEIPGLRFLPIPAIIKLRNNHIEVRRRIKAIIDKREEAMKIGKAKNDDFLGLLMESKHEEKQDKKAGLSISEVIEECKDFYLAGAEGVALLLTWTLFCLSIYPNWQESAREEVFKVFGNKEPKVEGLNQLKVVSNILYEVLRMFPPASMLTRVVSEDTKLGEFIIPAGATLQLLILVAHQDPEYWGDDAKEFNPDRFSEGVSKASKKQHSFFAFGGGPRTCTGQNFALMGAKSSLAMILQNFTFQLSPTYVHAPTKKLSPIQPQYGTPLVFHKIN